ncbi:MAG: hypothetical protein KDB45_03935 [Mycobacterium sp.]|nr:hypothetical protein [Mycobacterium sp.]
MRGAFGPILTTGVALTAAAVVVANPVVPPRSDVQIPAIQLSAGSGDALGMLDEDFLNAIAPAPPESNNPFVIIKDLITSLAADATYLGTNAIVDAFVAGATVVTQPELTALAVPYVPDVQFYPSLADAVPDVVSPLPVPLESVVPSELVLPAGALTDLTPVVADVVHAVVNDVSYVGNQLVTAAFAAGAVLAAEPGLIIDTLRSLISGDVRQALKSAVAVVVAPLGPPRMILDALRTVVEQRLPALPAVGLMTFAPPLAVEVPASGSSLPADVPAPDNATDTAPASAGAASVTVAGPGRKAAVVEAPAAIPRPLAGLDTAAAEVIADDVTAEVPAEDASSAAGGTDLSDGNKATPSRRPGRPGPLGQAAVTVAEQAQTALKSIGDAVGKAAGRASRAASGSDSGR